MEILISLWGIVKKCFAVLDSFVRSIFNSPLNLFFVFLIADVLDWYFFGGPVASDDAALTITANNFKGFVLYLLMINAAKAMLYYYAFVALDFVIKLCSKDKWTKKEVDGNDVYEFRCEFKKDK